MTAHASLHVAAPTTPARTPQRRSSVATWVAILTLLAALVGAGVSMTATQADWTIAQVQ